MTVSAKRRVAKDEIPGFELLSPPLQQAVKHVARTGLKGDIRHLESRYEPPGFQTLCRIIAFQQLSGAHALRMCKIVEAHFGGTFPNPEDFMLGRAGPVFLEAGVAPFRVGFMLDLAKGVQAGEVAVPERLGTDTAEVLQSIRGVGPWTADMYRMFALRDMDVWPMGDVGVRKGLEAFRKSGTEVSDSGAEWAPFRSVASWFLWQLVPGFPVPGFRDPPGPRQSVFARPPRGTKSGESTGVIWG